MRTTLKTVLDDTFKQDAYARLKFLKIYKSGDIVNLEQVQTSCRCSYYSANRILETLLVDGIIERTDSIDEYKLL